MVYLKGHLIRLLCMVFVVTSKGPCSFHQGVKEPSKSAASLSIKDHHLSTSDDGHRTGHDPRVTQHQNDQPRVTKHQNNESRVTRRQNNESHVTQCQKDRPCVTQHQKDRPRVTQHQKSSVAKHRRSTTYPVVTEYQAQFGKRTPKPSAHYHHEDNLKGILRCLFINQFFA